MLVMFIGVLLMRLWYKKCCLFDINDIFVLFKYFFFLCIMLNINVFNYKIRKYFFYIFGNIICYVLNNFLIFIF